MALSQSIHSTSPHITHSPQSIAIDKIISFRSKIQQSSIPLKYNNTHSLTINNTTYLIGDHAEQIDISLDKSNSKLHYLATLTALGLFGSGNYNLVANLPLNHFNKQNKEAFEITLPELYKKDRYVDRSSLGIKCVKNTELNKNKIV